MKLNDLALLIVLFIIISFILSVFNIVSIAMTEILAYSLLVIGIALVYTEIIRQNRLSVFIGSIIFLFGVYFLVTENFNLNIGNEFYISLILIFGGSGLLMLYLTNGTQKIFLYLSVIFLSAGIAILISNSHWKIKTFFTALFPVLTFLLPVMLVFIVLIFLMRTK